MAIMSAELESIYKGILSNSLPQVIKSASFPSLKSLSSFISNLKKRVQFFNDWLDMKPADDFDIQAVQFNKDCYNPQMDKQVLCQLKNYMPNKFWLGAFHFPHGFFTGILQHHARIYTLSID